MEAKTHYTLDRHAHTCTQASAPNGAERQLHSESTKECIRSPSWQGRQGLNPGPHRPQLLPINCPASCQREGAESTGAVPEGGGGRECNANLVGGPGVREAALETQGKGLTPDLRNLRGSTPRPCPSRGFKDPEWGAGLALQLGPTSPELNTHLVNLGARLV